MKPLLFCLAFFAGLAIACGADDSSNDSAGSAASMGSTGSIGSAPEGADGPSASASNLESSAARLVVTSQITLEVTDLRTAYQGVGDIARSFGGFVAEGRLSSAEKTDEGNDASSAYVRLRVPAEQHDAVLTGLRDTAGDVRSEETTTREITGEFTDLRSRLANLERSEAQYQELLTRSGSIDDILDVTSRLDEVRAEIEQVQGRINLLSDQSDFATVSVTMVVPAIGAETSTSGLPSPLRVFVDAAEGSVTVAHALLNVAAVALVAAIWLLPLAAAYMLLRRPLQRLLLASKARPS